MEKWPIGVFASIDAGMGVHLEVARELGVRTVQLHAPRPESRGAAAARDFARELQEYDLRATCVFGGFDDESYADIPTVRLICIFVYPVQSGDQGRLIGEMNCHNLFLVPLFPSSNLTATFTANRVGWITCHMLTNVPTWYQTRNRRIKNLCHQATVAPRFRNGRTEKHKERKGVVMRLDGKQVVVIGGSSGIGLETARLALSLGAYVTIAGRSEDRLSRAAATLKKVPERLRTVVADVADGQSIQSLFLGESQVDHVFVPAGELRPQSADLLTGT